MKCLSLDDSLQLLTNVLRGGAEDHAKLASRAISGRKSAEKAVESCSRELAASDLAAIGQSDRAFFIKHRKFCDQSYLNAFISEKLEGLLACLLIGLCTKEEPGQMVISGPEEDVKAVGKRCHKKRLYLFFSNYLFSLISLAEGKGGGKGSRINAKVTKAPIERMENVLKKHFSKEM